MIQQTEKNKRDATEKEAEVREAYAALKAKLETVGNLIHDSVPVNNDEVCSFCLHCERRVLYTSVWCFHLQANNAVNDAWGEKLVASPGFKLKNHVDLVELLDIADTKRGTSIGFTHFVTS